MLSFIHGMLGWCFCAVTFAFIHVCYEKGKYLKTRQALEAAILKHKENEIRLQEAYLNIDEKLKNLKETDQTYDA